MMRHAWMRCGWVLGGVLLLGLLGSARADRTTDVLDQLETELQQRVDENAGADKKLEKLLAKSLKKLGKTADGLDSELKLAAGVLGTLQNKRLAGDAELNGLIDGAVDAYVQLVQDQIDALAADVDGLPAKKATPAQANKALAQAQAKFTKATSARTAKAIVAKLLAALKSTAKGNKVVARLSGGGGGGGTLCGPNFYSASGLLRVRANGESMTATVGTASFVADSFVAARHDFLPNAIQLGGFQCSPEVDIELVIPTDPPIDTEMNQTSHPVLSATSADCFECLQTSAGNVRVTITQYDASGGTIAGTFEFSGHETVTNGSFVVKSWRTQ